MFIFSPTWIGGAQAYTLEKDIVLFSEPVEKFNRVRLYVIITSNLPAEVLALASRCAAGGADCIQLRAKDIPDDRLFALSVEFVEICREMGVRVPGDLAIVSFDDIELAQYAQLTTMRQPMHAMGELALEKLMLRIKDPKAPATVTSFMPELVVRESCGASAPAGAGASQMLHQYRTT